jgi:mono/diheme cytochrome c family protein
MSGGVHPRRRLWLVPALLWMVLGCQSEGEPQRPGASPIGYPAPRPRAVRPPVVSVAIDAGSAEPEPEAALQCIALRSKEPIPALNRADPDGATAAERAVFTRDVFSLFKGACGACHVETDRGAFRVKDVISFASATGDRQQRILDRIRSDDASRFMPPPGQGNARAWSDRSADDPVVELAKSLEAWFAAGSPPDLFYLRSEDEPEQAAYELPPHLAASLSNIGTCLPERAMVGRDPAGMDDRDALFETATALPASLDQTDLVTFDSQILASTGVIAYAPTYPLYSDGSRKLRHIRLPRGKKLLFNKTRQELALPDNTRLYKTFFKKVIGVDGTERYRKIETRIIVARSDGPDGLDGAHETRALFGTYAWNEQETEALLVSDPLRNGQPFRDRLLTYVTDEGKAAQVLAGDPYNKVVALAEAGATRNYAIPGSERCVQCHMGSPTRSFVLGITPLQLLRRPSGEGGTYEFSSNDEVAQVQRFLDYDLISGLGDPDDITPLERSQGPERPPRNNYELTAQGYMLGNCAHCHNPRGYPSVQNPELRELLNFLPSAAGGGIFQFPLERVSPRIKRGAAQNVGIPYITPGLFDQEQDAVGGTYAPKHLADDDGQRGYYLAAPWRSLIYRNVDTPFTYSEDYALYPRMPMNGAGFDCRAPRIFGDWMVSIPVLLRNPAGCTPNCPSCANPCINEATDPSPALPNPQLYAEVKAGEAEYAQAVVDAQARLTRYHEGGTVKGDPLGTGWKQTYLVPYRYADYCPDDGDTIDPDVQGDVLTPQDFSSLPSLRKQLEGDESIRGKFAALADGVPDRPHWVVTDTTETPGDWYPRRTDWAAVLVERKLDGVDELQRKVVQMLGDVRVSDTFKAYATTPWPFGLWEKKSSCRFDAIPKVSSVASASQVWWLEDRVPKPAATDPVYYLSPGGVVFHEICVNCHGARYDSRGRQADTLVIMTGGDARVANFRDGLLGPAAAPGANVERVFGSVVAPGAPANAQDWAARYVAWMGLGGTQRKIPQPILNVVGAVSVLGESRPFVPPPTSANMLSIARSLCAQSVGRTDTSQVEFDVERGRIKYALRNTALIAANGDAQVWQELCAHETSPPVRTLQYTGGTTFKITLSNNLDERSAWYRASTYPAGALIGDARGQLGSSAQSGVSADNLGPWCVLAPQTPELQAQLEALERTRGRPLPRCPSAWLSDANRVGEDEFQRWTLRAAANAGIAVFLYLDRLAHDALRGGPPLPPYDHCEQLP